MVRPTFIVAEPAPPEGLSSRKLVIETAYYNVLTVHSASELMEIIDIFPKADAVIIHVALPHLNMSEATRKVREKMPNSLIIALAQTSSAVHNEVDELLSSHEPQALLALLEERFGRPEEAA